MASLYVGVDLAKNVFAVHGVDAAGKPALVRPVVRRCELMELLAKLRPCTIGMEACSGAHFFAAKLRDQGNRFPRSSVTTRSRTRGGRHQVYPRG